MELRAQSSQYRIFKGLSAAYVDHDPRVATLYSMNFRDPQSLQRRLEALDAQPVERKALCDALETYNSKLGGSEKTLMHIAKLRQQDAVVVVTGQQAGIFTGALYTVYKAISTLKLAAGLEKTLGRPVVPVFWIASEDHDFQEIRATHYLTGGKLRKVVIDKSDRQSMKRVNLKKMSVGHLETNTSVRDSIEQILSDFSGDEPIEHFETLLSTTFIEKDSLSNWFGRIMSRLFHDYGLVMLDPMLPELRAMEAEFFKTAIQKQPQIIHALEKQSREVERLGFQNAVTFDSQGLQLFIYEREERLALRKDSEGFYCESTDQTYRYSEEALLERATRRPQDFSTNVVLRPVVQDVLLPTLAYVAGPGELNYYGQLERVYGVFGKQPPIYYPRENFTLVPKEVNQMLGHYDLTAENVLMCGISTLRDHLLDLRDDVRIDALFNDYTAKFESEYRAMLEKVLEISPDLKTLSEKNISIIKGQMDYLKEKAHRFHRRNHRQVTQDLSAVEAHLMPGGHLQERTLSILQYYADQGNTLIDFLLGEVPYDPEHRIILLG